MRMISPAQTITRLPTRVNDSCASPCDARENRRPADAIKRSQSVGAYIRSHTGSAQRTGAACPSAHIHADLHYSLNPVFCHRFNDATLAKLRVASYQRWPSWAELRRYLPVRVNEMTPVCLRVTVIFAETAVAAEIRIPAPSPVALPHLICIAFRLPFPALPRHAPPWSTGSFALLLSLCRTC